MWDILGNIAGSVLGFMGQEDTNDQNLAIANNNSAFNAEQAALGRDFNSAEAMKQRQWASEERGIAQNYNSYMANTSWQRGVQDMQAAGINPMLAYMKGGAPAPTMGTPSGSSASGPTATAAGNAVMQNSIANAIGTAQGIQSAVNLAKQGSNIDADTLLKIEQAKREASAVNYNTNAAINQLTQSHLNIERIPQIRQEIRKMDHEIWRIDSESDRNRAETFLKQAQRFLTIAETKRSENYGQGAMFQADMAIRKAQQILTDAHVPFAKQQAEFSASNTGHIVNWLKLLTGQSTAGNLETLMKVTRP